ncbi:hypothetical protein JL108_07925 [Aeromicrobium sp. YIM 150415]|uniref:DUF5819 family protein n=1 Tax=Aeromicrobium sp. YIM 150415 TaxID=2803912 RepID=UPI001965DFF7|nr:DUF5819 family protein [Aeromicrobium sp. YIM 150415]MBM9463374.1 hypothetical protein [Aeromicrobium sp. YIM 150415]
MNSASPSSRRPSSSSAARSPVRRASAWFLVAIVLAHTAIIALWVGPSTPLRNAVGDERLRSYVMPFFDQNWRIFAPTPRRAAVTFEIRASIEDPTTGETSPTDWIDVVEREDDIIRGNMTPSRMSLAGRRTANTLNSVMAEMNERQRTQIAANYLTTPVADLRGRLADIEGGAGISDVSRYMRYDEIATSLATYYASTVWEGDIAYVQYRTSIRYVPGFDQRKERDIDDAERTYYEYGWRSTTPPDADVTRMFSAYTGEEPQ